MRRRKGTSTTVWAATASSAGGCASTTAGQMVLSIKTDTHITLRAVDISKIKNTKFILQKAATFSELFTDTTEANKCINQCIFIKMTFVEFQSSAVGTESLTFSLTLGVFHFMFSEKSTRQ